jgi:dienelactone hydrolase
VKGIAATGILLVGFAVGLLVSRFPRANAAGESATPDLSHRIFSVGIDEVRQNFVFDASSCKGFVAVLLSAICSLEPVRAEGLIEEALRIPMREAGSRGLEAIMVRPNDDLAHPLALLTHGTPREADKRDEITALTFVPHAREFARRGWTTVVVVRRGYGTSGGRYVEEAHGCSSDPDYYNAGRESAKDLRASINYLSGVAHVDASRVLSVGVSTGGFANVALTAEPPPNLVAAISFAGGRGSIRPDTVCGPYQLARAFARFGETSRVPMLWIYAENDHFFPLRLAASFYEAFTHSGGTVTFIRAPAYRRDGHGLFSSGGIPLWTPIVDSFLAAQNLILRTDLLPLPVAPAIAPPGPLSVQAQSEWRSFLTFPERRAFAVSAGGHYGYAYGRASDKDANSQALEHCEDAAPRGDRCQLVAIPSLAPAP